MASRAAALLALLCISVKCASCEYSNATTLSMQLDTMLAEYERDAPPAARVQVRLDLDVKHAAIDQQHETMRLLADLKMSWVDARVVWNASEWGTNSTLVSAERLWRPELVLLNAAAAGAGGGDELRARVAAGGAVSWVKRLDVAAPVTMDLTAWPHDAHTGTFVFGSRTFSPEEMELEVSEFEHAIVFETGAWEIVSVAGSARQGDVGDAGAAVWAVRVARRAPAQAAAGGACAAAAGLLLLAATAQRGPPRLALAACASVVAALWLVTSVARLPGGRGAPRSVSVVCALCACGAAFGAGAACAARLARCSARPPRRLRSALSALSGLCRLTPAQEESAACGRGAWAAAALLAERVLSAALLLALLVLLVVYVC